MPFPLFSLLDPVFAFLLPPGKFGVAGFLLCLEFSRFGEFFFVVVGFALLLVFAAGAVPVVAFGERGKVRSVGVGVGGFVGCEEVKAVGVEVWLGSWASLGG